MRSIGLSAPDISQAEIDAVVAVMKTNSLSLGPKLPEFEQNFADYVGRKYAVAVNSGTSAMFLVMAAMGVGPGDEVITTPFSFITTTNVILMVGATPVFVDIDPETYNIDVNKIEAAITDKTKAIIPVEVFGNPKDLDKVYEIALEHGLYCLEDSCEALGSEVNGKKCGTLGHASTFAFYPNKQMTTGEGGIVLTDDKKIADMCNSLRNQGRDPDAGWLAHARLGYNYRLSDINCAMGVEQLKRIDGFIGKRRHVAALYNEAFAGEDRLVLPKDPENCLVDWFVYVVRLAEKYTQQDRDKVLEVLRSKNIGCNNYFTPIHLQPFIAEMLGCKEGDYPITEKVAQRTIALPFHNNLPKEDVEYVVAELRGILDSL
ncbi:MAG: DegT/DnrJ/EryC1/StrS family aminotransferase [Phycisphaerae bacterium]|nr:DegT/DnrJ/EryC1/StrS family aminotransferase [Phycisphaerae bacterium]